MFAGGEIEGLEIYEVRAGDELEVIRGLALKTWGEGAADSVATLMIHARYGGVVLLARLHGVPVGFSYAFPVYYREEFVLWSHETAVLEPDRHIGRTLKLRQFEIASRLGYATIAWTFDPLIARNAYFNLVVLGATVTDFVPDAYSGPVDSPAGSTPTTDRFIVTYRLGNALSNRGASLGMHAERTVPRWWDGDDPRTVWLLQGDGEAPVLKRLRDEEGAGKNELELCVAIPDFSGLGRPVPAAVRAQWSLPFRTVMLDAFTRGLRPVGVVRRSDGSVHGYHMRYGHSNLRDAYSSDS